MAHITGVCAHLVVVGSLAGACSGSDESRAAGAKSAVTDSATLAASAASSAELRVSNVMIGRQVGPGNRITEPTFEFAPTDTVHLSVATQGTGGADKLTAAWRFQSGEILQQSSEAVRPAGENTAFRLSQPKGLKLGNYKVIVFLGGDSVETKTFLVRKQQQQQQP